MAAVRVILMLICAICSVANSHPQYYTELLHQIQQPQNNPYQIYKLQLPLPEKTTTHTQYYSIPQVIQEYQGHNPQFKSSSLSPTSSLSSTNYVSANNFNNNHIFHSFEPAEFVPLEAQQQQKQQQQQHIHKHQQHHPHNDAQVGRTHPEKPFEVDVITSDVNGGNGHLPGIFFQQAFPFLGNSFLNSFGGFGIGTQQEPWWKGPNVCTTKEEDEKMEQNDEHEEEHEETVSADGTELVKQQSYLGQFQFSMNSCLEKSNKYVCRRVVNKNGKKKTLSITRQCCYGYGRPRNAAYSTPCDKIDIKDIEATAADVGAKEFVVKAKNSGLNDMIANHRNFTMFLPVDDAFNSYTDLLQSESNLVEGQTNDGMKELFLRHMVDGEINLDDVHNEQLLKTKVDGQNIRINSYQVPLSLSSESYRYTANCVPIVKHDKLTEQGVVHTLDGIMEPVDKNLMDIIRDRNDLSIMRTVLEKTNISKLLESNKTLTIFVPNDTAFDKLEPHLRRALKEGKGCASNILKNHILDLTFCSVASVPDARTTAYNLLGEPMRFNRTKLSEEEKKQNKAKQQPIVINGVTNVLETDIMGTNGVMHIVDTIMPTESALPLSSLMEEKNITLFKRLLESSGLDNNFDDMDNLTVFAPTDKALQNTKWAKLLDENPAQLKGNQELDDFVLYHIVQPMIKTCDLKEQLLPTINGKTLRINLYSTHSLFTNVMNRATVNCARLVNFDDESCGSVMHQVDKPLAPPHLNLLELLESNPSYSKFLELIQATNLTDILSSSEQDYTLLVPKNDVFDELDENVSKNPTELENLIKTHIVNDVICCAGIVPTNWPFVRTIESLNGHHLRVSRERRPKIQNAGITKCDTIATNGIIHEINDIVVPPSRQQQQRPSTHFTHNSPEDIFSDIFF